MRVIRAVGARSDSGRYGLGPGLRWCHGRPAGRCLGATVNAESTLLFFFCSYLSVSQPPVTIRLPLSLLPPRLVASLPPETAPAPVYGLPSRFVIFRSQTSRDGNIHISGSLQPHDQAAEQGAFAGFTEQQHKTITEPELPEEHAHTAGLKSIQRLPRRRRLQGEAHRPRGAGERDRRAGGQLHPGRGRGIRPRPALLLPRRRVLHVRRQGPGGLRRPVGPVVPRRYAGRRRVRAHLRRVPDVRLRHPDTQGGRPVLAQSHARISHFHGSIRIQP